MEMISLQNVSRLFFLGTHNTFIYESTDVNVQARLVGKMGETMWKNN